MALSVKSTGISGKLFTSIDEETVRTVILSKYIVPSYPAHGIVASIDRLTASSRNHGVSNVLSKIHTLF